MRSSWSDLGPAVPESLSRVLTVARIVVGVFFLYFGEYKVIPGAAGFSNGVVQGYLQEFVQRGYALGFYRSFLAALVLPRAGLVTVLVGVLELSVGLCMVLGLWVRPASAAGALHMISLTLATWHEAGPQAAAWRWFGVQLDHVPMLLLFAIFYFAGAGRHWGIDGFVRRSRRAKQ